MEHCEKAKAKRPEKLVDFDELRDREWRLRDREFTFTEKLFEAFVDLPHKAWLFLRRGVSEGIDLLRGRDTEDKNARVFEDMLSDRVFMNRATMEDDLSYNLRHGLKHSFQAKAADLRRRAFDECEDYGFLIHTKKLLQLRPMNR